jgi:hypothetical protein
VFCYKEGNGLLNPKPFFSGCFGLFTINNDLVVFKMFRVIMAKGKILKKIGGDLKA